MLKIYRYIFLFFVLGCYHQAPLNATNKQKKEATTKIGCFFFSQSENLENIKISTEKKFVLIPYVINIAQPNKVLKKIANNKPKLTRILIDIRHLQQQLELTKKDNSIGNGNKKQNKVNDEVYNALKTYLTSIASYLDDALNTQIYFVIGGTKNNKKNIIEVLQSYVSQFSSCPNKDQSQNKMPPLLQLFMKEGDNKPFIALSENKEKEGSMIMCATFSFYEQSKPNLKVVGNKNDKYKIVLSKSVLKINHREVTKDDKYESQQKTPESILFFAGKTNNNVEMISTVIKNKVNFSNNNATNYYIDLTANSLPSTTKDEVVDYFEKVTEYLRILKNNNNDDFLKNMKNNIWFVIPAIDRLNNVKAFLKNTLSENKKTTCWTSIMESIKQTPIPLEKNSGRTSTRFILKTKNPKKKRKNIKKEVGMLIVNNRSVNNVNVKIRDQLQTFKKVTFEENIVEAGKPFKENTIKEAVTDYYIDLTANSLSSMKSDAVTTYFDNITKFFSNIKKESIKKNVWFVISPNDTIENVKKSLGEKLNNNENTYPWLDLLEIKFVKLNVDTLNQNSFQKKPIKNKSRPSSSRPTSVQKPPTGSNSPKANSQKQYKLPPSKENNKNGNNGKSTVTGDTNNSTNTGSEPVESKTRNLTNFIIIATGIVLILIVRYLISRASKPKQAFPNRGSRPIQPSTSHTLVPKETPVSKQIKAQASSSKGSPAKAPLVFKYKSLIIAIALLLLLALLFLLRRSVIPNK